MNNQRLHKLPRSLISVLSGILLVCVLTACEAPGTEDGEGGGDCSDQVLTKDKEIETLRVENYSLQKNIDELKEKFREESKRCDLAESIEKNALERKESAEREGKRVQEKAAAILEKQQALLARAKEGSITITEWQDILFGKSKAEVITLLGKPASIKRPGQSSELVNELWTYPAKVLVDGTKTEHIALVVQLSDDKVQRVTAGR